jgi:methyl-accepting chemotaxis protein
MKFRRRNYIVNKKMQLRYSLLFLVVSLVGSILSVALFNILAVRRLESLMWKSHLNLQSTGEVIRPLALYVNIADFLFVLVLLILIASWMMKKTSGPLFRIANDIDQIASGDLSRNIVLRRKDEFQDVADDLNDMTGQLRQSFAGIKEDYARVAESVSDLKKAVESGKDIVEAVQKIESQISALENRISAFKR